MILSQKTCSRVSDLLLEHRASKADLLEAIVLQNKVLQASPRTRHTRMLRAEYLYTIGDSLGAYADLDTLIEQDPYTIEPYYAMGLLRAKYGNIDIARNYWQRGVKMAEQDLERYPKDIQIIGNIAYGYMLLGDKSKALKLIQRAKTCASEEELPTLEAFERSLPTLSADRESRSVWNWFLLDSLGRRVQYFVPSCYNR